jgi:hypothetical protein
MQNSTLLQRLDKQMNEYESPEHPGEDCDCTECILRKALDKALREIERLTSKLEDANILAQETDEDEYIEDDEDEDEDEDD